MFAVEMKKQLQPFCYELLTEMMPYKNDLPKAKNGTAYVCSVWDCLVSYKTLNGYFMAVKEGDGVDQGTTPSVCCPNDRTPMYLQSLTRNTEAIVFGNAHSAARASRIWSPSKVGNDPPKLALVPQFVRSKPPV